MTEKLQELIYTYPRVEHIAKAPLVKDVWIANHRAIFNRDWTLNKEASHHFLYWDCNLNSRNHASKGLNFEQRCDQIAESAKLEKILELPEDKTYALCSHYWKGYPFGHWFETLASLRFIPKDDFHVLYYKTGGPVSTRDIDLHLEIIGIEKDRQLYIDLKSIAVGLRNLTYARIDYLELKSDGWSISEQSSNGLEGNLKGNLTLSYTCREIFRFNVKISTDQNCVGRHELDFKSSERIKLICEVNTYNNVPLFHSTLIINLDNEGERLLMSSLHFSTEDRESKVKPFIPISTIINIWNNISKDYANTKNAYLNIIRLSKIFIAMIYKIISKII
jgi:hypothetical protein